MSEQLGEPVMSVVKLPDGRWAARNERDVSDLTQGDCEGITDAFALWMDMMMARRGWEVGSLYAAVFVVTERELSARGPFAHRHNAVLEASKMSSDPDEALVVELKLPSPLSLGG